MLLHLHIEEPSGIVMETLQCVSFFFFSSYTPTLHTFNTVTDQFHAKSLSALLAANCKASVCTFSCSTLPCIFTYKTTILVVMAPFVVHHHFSSDA